ncbi:MAG TPA: tail fiber domain-containing protein [Allosphingosinicella sp.]|jgi:hypothetical protein
MADTAWGDFDDATYLEAGDVGLMVRGSGGKNFPLSMLVYKAADGRFKAGAGMDVTGSLLAPEYYATGGTLLLAKAGDNHLFYEPSGTSALRAGGVGDQANYYDNASHVFRGRGAAASYATLNGSGFLAGADNVRPIGGPSNRWSVIYSGTGSINTSDEREKVQIGTFPDAWLDAWDQVEWGRFKFANSVQEKGDDARWHAGAIAQQVHAAFAAHGLDAFAIGLCCLDEWEASEAVPAVLDGNDNVLKPDEPERPAGDRWGLRYTECFSIEAAYQRRRMARIEARLAALEA